MARMLGPSVLAGFLLPRPVDEHAAGERDQQINLDHPALVGKISHDDLMALAEAALAE
jgi:hypothetical protein